VKYYPRVSKVLKKLGVIAKLKRELLLEAVRTEAEHTYIVGAPCNSPSLTDPSSIPSASNPQKFAIWCDAPAGKDYLHGEFE